MPTPDNHELVRLGDGAQESSEVGGSGSLVSCCPSGGQGSPCAFKDVLVQSAVSPATNISNVFYNRGRDVMNTELLTKD